MSESRPRRWLVVLAALGPLASAGLPGCTMARARAEHVLTGTPRTAYAGTVRLFLEGAPAPTEVEEVAIISATGGSARAMLPDVMGALQARAAELGCNGVIRVRYDRGAEGATATGVGVWIR